MFPASPHDFPHDFARLGFHSPSVSSGLLFPSQCNDATMQPCNSSLSACPVVPSSRSSPPPSFCHPFFCLPIGHLERAASFPRQPRIHKFSLCPLRSLRLNPKLA